MAYCKFCGKELGEDGKCTCAEFGDFEKNSGVLSGTVEQTPEKPIKRDLQIKVNSHKVEFTECS